MNSKPVDFCVEILPQVSRTFAINIRVLSGELHRAVLCAYLFCRVVDTAEDSEQLPVNTRLDLLHAYKKLFESRSYDSKSIESWIGAWGVLNEADPEHRLMRNLRQVVSVFLELPEAVRSSIESCVVEMSAGMEKTVRDRHESAKNLFVLQSIADLEQYCHYVAGTVGKMLTDLFIHYSPSMTEVARSNLRRLGPSFALGLQMTNIIKDCYADYQRGWCYVPEQLARESGIDCTQLFDPSRRAEAQPVLDGLVQIAASHLDKALDYTLTLPTTQIRIRLFNLWSLFFAIKTLVLAWNNPALLDGKFKVKISRREVYLTLFQTLVRVRSDKALRRLYDRYRRSIPK